MTFAHLAEAIDGVLRRLGGTTRAWRTDRMATVVCPGSDRVTAQFAQLAKHYGVEVWICPPRRPQRKGVVEAAIKYVTRSWWQSAPVASLGQAQTDLDRWSVAVSDRRKRRGATIGELAAGEGLLGLPAAAFPAQLAVERVVSRTALVTFEGNHYSVSPGLAGQTVTVRARSASSPWRSSLRPVAAWPATGALPPAPASSCARPSTRGHSSKRSSTHLRPRGPAAASEIARPDRRRCPKRLGYVRERRGSSSISTTMPGSQRWPADEQTRHLPAAARPPGLPQARRRGRATPGCA